MIRGSAALTQGAGGGFQRRPKATTATTAATEAPATTTIATHARNEDHAHTTCAAITSSEHKVASRDDALRGKMQPAVTPPLRAQTEVVQTHAQQPTHVTSDRIDAEPPPNASSPSPCDESDSFSECTGTMVLSAGDLTRLRQLKAEFDERGEIIQQSEEQQRQLRARIEKMQAEIDRSDEERIAESARSAHHIATAAYCSSAGAAWHSRSSTMSPLLPGIAAPTHSVSSSARTCLMRRRVTAAPCRIWRSVRTVRREEDRRTGDDTRL